MTSNAETRADVVVYRNGVAHCSVCAPADLAQNEVEAAVNFQNPAGTSWKVSESGFTHGEPNPCVCHVDDDRQHWLMSC